MGPNAIKPSGRVCLLKVLNRRVRNRTHGGVRGRSLLAPPTRFLHDIDQNMILEQYWLSIILDLKLK